MESEHPPKSRHDYRETVQIIITGLALVILAIAIYQNFILGNKTLLYRDIGTDSINVYYPRYVLRSDYLREVGIFSWSFQVGMGQNIFPSMGNLLLIPVTWLPKAAIAKAIVYQHLLYIVISGLLFARFLALRGLALGSCLLGALLLSFSAYMCMGSCWYFHAYEVVCFTFLLLAAEQAVGRSRWIWLVPGVAVVGSLGAFHLYLCALFLSFYVPFRFVEKYSWQPLPILRTSALLATVALLGVGLTAVFSLGSLYGQLNSPRGSGLLSLAHTLSSTPFFGLESSLHYITALLRPFGNDMLGTGSDFRGWQSYLEAPMTYCGLICLLLLPQVFVAARSQQQIIYALFFGLVLITTVFPWFRYLFWAFQGDYYRALSLFTIFGVITLSMTALTRYLRGHTLNVWLLTLTIAVLLAILYFPLHQLQTVISPSLRLAAAIFLIIYTALLVVGQMLKRQETITWIIIALAAVELVFFDRITVSSRPTVTKQQLNERVGYNDETVDAVREINASDHGFFRIRKTWASGLGKFQSLNDAMVFGFYGTSSYSSFNNLNYIRFLKEADAVSSEDKATLTRWALGLIEQPVLSIFACEKYLLTPYDPAPFERPELYEFVKSYGDIYLFRNRLFVPFGITFDDYLPEDDFLRLTSEEKHAALLHTVVLSEKNGAGKEELSRLATDVLKHRMREASIPEIIAVREATALRMSSFGQTRIDGVTNLKKKGILVLQMPFDQGWRAFQDGRAVQVLKVDIGLLGVVLDGGEHEIELRYRPPFLVAGATISFISLSIMIFCWWRWPQVRLPAAC